MIFLFFGERGEGEWEMGEANINWGFEGVCKLPASYQQVRGVARWGIKVEFGGFIGGFGKNFFTKEGIKRGRESFWGRWGKKKNRERIGGILGYVWEGTIY